MRRVEDMAARASCHVDASSPVSVVVIGLNEAQHLPACFASISASSLKPCEILYVDSGSTDASMAIADRCGATVLSLEGRPASAAAARNVGLAHVRGEFVHFVDGDMTLDCQWVEAAHSALEADGSLACVFGPVLETGTSLADRIIGRDWSQRQPGVAEAPGSGGMFRTQVLRHSGGYSEKLIAGEETELGGRLRGRGFGIQCLPATMGCHELGIASVKDYWKRWARGGLARWEWSHSQRLTPAELVAAAKPLFLTGGALTAVLLLTLGRRRWRYLGVLGTLGLVGLVVRLTIRAVRGGEALPIAVASSLENYLRCLPISAGFVGAAVRSIGTSLSSRRSDVSERRG